MTESTPSPRRCPVVDVDRYEEVKDGLRLPEVFTNDKVNAFDPEMELRLLPQTLNGLTERGGQLSLTSLPLEWDSRA